MTEITTDQQQMEAAARSVATKLQAFHEGLTPHEQQMLGLAFRAVAAAGSDEDAAGYSYIDGIGEVRDWCLTLAAVADPRGLAAATTAWRRLLAAMRWGAAVRPEQPSPPQRWRWLPSEPWGSNALHAA